ncbi:unnamed protein product [Staurois parvus]|uniref:Uncharacterized protein n=1 Tax=Staurois parvus TaxID=386267 RepID=A0ABN9H7S3_9NEOB|nr:unnamed protein product [Staurois parvus]
MIDGTDWHHCWALTGGTDWHNPWALTGSTAGLHWWVALVGSTGGWAQVGGTGGCTAGHRWAELAGWHCWAPIIRALIISVLMIGADPRCDNCRFSGSTFLTI